MLRQTVPLLFTITLGVLTLIGLLFLPALANLLLGWAALLAAIALLFGVLNLLLIHGRRLLSDRNLYSLALIVSLVGVVAAAVGDGLGLFQNGVGVVFQQLLIPLEAALASLVAFFLLFAGIRLLHRQRSGWSILFLVTVLLILAASVPLPLAVAAEVGDSLALLRDAISTIVVTAGTRGILLGVALGTITITLRLLAGRERPYSK